MLSTLAVVVSTLPLLAFPRVEGDPPPPARAAASQAASTPGHGAVRTPSMVRRVGGDREVAIDVVDGIYRCGGARIESPLPDGYPEPTPPGAIDIKNYPSIRRAEWRSKGPTGSGMNLGFWPLFNHIKKRDIPMTSPVEMDYTGVWPDPASTIEPQASGAWTMSFLYREVEAGPIGEEGGIHVVDTPAVTVVSVGLRGAYGIGTAQRGLRILKEWAESQASPASWELAGPVRVFHYNGPSVPEQLKWSEVQVPVRAVPSNRPSATAADVGAAASR